MALACESLLTLFVGVCWSWWEKRNRFDPNRKEYLFVHRSCCWSPRDAHEILPTAQACHGLSNKCPGNGQNDVAFSRLCHLWYLFERHCSLLCRRGGYPFADWLAWSSKRVQLQRKARKHNPPKFHEKQRRPSGLNDAGNFLYHSSCIGVNGWCAKRQSNSQELVTAFRSPGKKLWADFVISIFAIVTLVL